MRVIEEKKPLSSFKHFITANDHKRALADETKNNVINRSSPVKDVSLITTDTFVTKYHAKVIELDATKKPYNKNSTSCSQESSLNDSSSFTNYGKQRSSLTTADQLTFLTKNDHIKRPRNAWIHVSYQNSPKIDIFYAKFVVTNSLSFFMWYFSFVVIMDKHSSLRILRFAQKKFQSKLEYKGTLSLLFISLFFTILDVPPIVGLVYPMTRKNHGTNWLRKTNKLIEKHFQVTNIAQEEQILLDLWPNKELYLISKNALSLILVFIISSI